MDASGYIEMRSYFCSSSTNANLLITEALSSIAWGELPFYSRYGLSSTDIGKTINADNVTNGMWAIPITVHPISTSYLNLPNLLNKNL